MFTSQVEKLRPYLRSDRAVLCPRSADLDRDDVRGEDIYSAFIQTHPAEAYILYHVTSPFMATWYFEKAIEALESGYDSAFSVQEHRTFAQYKDSAINWSMPKLPRTQDLDPVYTMTSGFFAFTGHVWEKYKCRIGEKPKMIAVDQKAAIDIDYQEDFLMAEALRDVRIPLKEQS